MPERMTTTITPFLSVRNGADAIEFYKRAFGVKEIGRVDGPEGLILAELSLNGARFYVADENPENGNVSPMSVGARTTVRLELTVEDPDAVAVQAIAAGAKEVFPVRDQDYGWRQGRVVDPYGHQWVIGREIDSGRERREG